MSGDTSRPDPAAGGSVPVPENAAEIKKAALRQKTKTPMPMQDPAVRVHNFSEVELGYNFDLATY